MGTNSSVISPVSPPPPKPKMPRFLRFFSAGMRPSSPGTTATLSSKNFWNWFFRWESWAVVHIFFPAHLAQEVFDDAGAGGVHRVGAGRLPGSRLRILHGGGPGCGLLRAGLLRAGLLRAGLLRAGLRPGFLLPGPGGRGGAPCRLGGRGRLGTLLPEDGRSASRSSMAWVEKRDSGSATSALTSTLGISASGMGPRVAVTSSAGAVLRGMLRRISSTLRSVTPSRMPLASCSWFSSCRMRSTESFVRLLGMFGISPL